MVKYVERRIISSEGIFLSLVNARDLFNKFSPWEIKEQIEQTKSPCVFPDSL